MDEQRKMVILVGGTLLICALLGAMANPGAEPTAKHIPRAVVANLHAEHLALERGHGGVAKSLLITLCNQYYFPGAVQLLATAKDTGHWPGDMAVIVTPDVKPCARRIFESMDVHVINATSKWVDRPFTGVTGESLKTTTHYAKLDMFTDPWYRQYSKIVYSDADIKINSNMRALVSTTMERGQVVILPFIPNHHLYREVSSEAQLPPEFVEKYPDQQGVSSTRLMIIDVNELPSCETMAAEIEDLWPYLGYISVNWEQGLIQFLLYSKVQALHSMWSSTFTHYYHVNLPWKSDSPDLPALSRLYQTATGDSNCWQPAL